MAIPTQYSRLPCLPCWHMPRCMDSPVMSLGPQAHDGRWCSGRLCQRKQAEWESVMRWLPGVIGAGMVLWMGLEMGVAADPVPYEQRLAQALGFMQQGAWQQAVEAIGELPRKAALTPELARLWFVRGVLAQKLQDPDTAQQAFERVWQGYPPLADYAAWEMVQYDAARDFLPTLQKTVTTLVERYPFSRLLPESQLVLARAQHRSGQSAAARATLERLVRAAAEAPVHAEAMALLGRVYEERGEF